MLTALVLKGLYVVGGMVAGWLAKKWHVALDEAVRALADRDAEKTPNDRPGKTA